MYKLSLAEYQFATTTDELRSELLAMAREFSNQAGIDWQFEYRWMTMTDENYMLARLKHPLLIGALQVKKIHGSP